MAIINQSPQFVKQYIYTAGEWPEIQAPSCRQEGPHARMHTLSHTHAHLHTLTCSQMPQVLPSTHALPWTLVHIPPCTHRPPPDLEITRKAVPADTNLVHSHRNSSQAGPELHQHPGDSPREHSSSLAHATIQSRSFSTC